LGKIRLIFIVVFFATLILLVSSMPSYSQVTKKIFFPHHSMGSRLVGNRYPAAQPSQQYQLPAYNGEDTTWQILIPINALNIENGTDVQFFQWDREDSGYTSSTNRWVRDDFDDGPDYTYITDGSEYFDLSAADGYGAPYSLMGENSPPGNYPTVLYDLWAQDSDGYMGDQNYPVYTHLPINLANEFDVIVLKSSYQTTQWWGADGAERTLYEVFGNTERDDGDDTRESIYEYYFETQDLMLALADELAAHYPETIFVYIGLAPRQNRHDTPTYDDQITEEVAQASYDFNAWCRSEWVYRQPNLRYFAWYSYLADLDPESDDYMALLDEYEHNPGSDSDSHWSFSRGEVVGEIFGEYLYNLAVAEDSGVGLDNETYREWGPDYDGADPWGNSPPTFGLIQNATSREDSNYELDLEQYVSDVDEDPLTISVIGTYSNVAVEMISDFIVRITPDANWHGEVLDVTMQVTDGVATANSDFDIVFTPVNDPPTITDFPAYFECDEDDAVVEDLSDWTHDIDGDDLIYKVSGGNNIKVYVSGSNVIFHPQSNWNGTERFTFFVQDEVSSSTSVSFDIVVNPVNDAHTLEFGTLNLRLPIGSVTNFDISSYITDIDNEEEIFITDVTNLSAGDIIATYSGNVIEFSLLSSDVYTGQETFEVTVEDLDNTDTDIFTVEAYTPVSLDATTKIEPGLLTGYSTRLASASGWGLTLVMPKVESWVFSNSSTMYTGEYTHEITSVGGSGELNINSTTTPRGASDPLRFKVSGDGWPIDAYSEIAALLDFDVSDNIGGRNVIKSTLFLRATSWGGLSLGGQAMRMDVVGLLHKNLDDWIPYSTSTTSDVTFDYYDTSATSAWRTNIGTFWESTPNDGMTTSYPFGAGDQFWGIKSDTTFTDWADDGIITIDVTEIMQAWAAGEREGGLMLFGARSGSANPVFGNVNWTATHRPYLEVFTQ